MGFRWNLVFQIEESPGTPCAHEPLSGRAREDNKPGPGTCDCGHQRNDQGVCVPGRRSWSVQGWHSGHDGNGRFVLATIDEVEHFLDDDIHQKSPKSHRKHISSQNNDSNVTYI